MTRIARLRREQGRALALSMAAIIIAIHAGFASYWTFSLHPVLSILIGAFGVALVLVAIIAGHEASRLADLVHKEDRRGYRLPRE
jgi:hypothetical protein